MNNRSTSIPKVYQAFRDNWQQQQAALIERYLNETVSFIPCLLPEQAVQLPAQQTLAILSKKLGETLEMAISPTYTQPDFPPLDLPDALKSPVHDQQDTVWIKRANMVGINVRTIGSFWNVVKYVLTLPAAQSAIHLLPIWEPGVVASLYGMASWQINPAFYSQELEAIYPHLNSVEKQLKAVIHILHALGKTVGMDVIPHTDRFSEIVLTNPQYFEWLQRSDFEIVDHSEHLHEVVQSRIMKFLKHYGPSQRNDYFPTSVAAFFGDNFGASNRSKILFGRKEQPTLRSNRRNQLMRYLLAHGFEPVPATMAPPYRGLLVDTEKFEQDATGFKWREYIFEKPQAMSRVFGPLTRYKLYGRKDDNKNWEIDFDRPLKATWEYVGGQYYQMQRQYGFDFMRGDMSHVQMRPNGVPAVFDGYYDILGYVQHYIQKQGLSYFAYFAESFLAPRGVMGYGDEVNHLEASDAAVTLGDLQSTIVGSPIFLQRFRQYLDILQTRLVAPCFTIMTADKDDPRFDKFYVAGNEVRLFIALFLTNMPSYMGLGFQTRDVHYAPVSNEHYTKLYVFQIDNGPKATHGAYIWGKNGALYHRLTRIKLYADSIWKKIQAQPVRWLLPPDATGHSKVIAWTQQHKPRYIFVANLDTNNAIANFAIPKIADLEQMCDLIFQFSTVNGKGKNLVFNGKHYGGVQLMAGEGKVYEI